MNNRIKSLALLVNLEFTGLLFVKRGEKPPPTIKTAPLKRPWWSPPPSRTCRRRASPPSPPMRSANALARDVSEIIRTMPGVNLTGNSTSGQRGNNRQIDIRGMGPENTLILIDGKPVTSRNSVRLGWRGERDTRGDTSWVPPGE